MEDAIRFPRCFQSKEEIKHGYNTGSDYGGNGSAQVC